MVRGHRLLFGALAFLAFPLLEANAQYYYPYGIGGGGYGFGGWGATPDGDIARGMGAFVAAAGVYNYDSATAASINADTVMRVNEYLYQSQLEANRLFWEYENRKVGRSNAVQANALASMARIRDNPTEADIDSGAALNAVLDQLSDPKILNGSALRMANAKIEAGLIREIPFRDATDAITITLSQLTDEKSWPLPLRAPEFAEPRAAYTKAVADALEEDKNGDLSPFTIQRVRQTVFDLYRRVNETIPRTRQPDHLDSLNYLKGLAGFSRMLEKSNFEKVLAELGKIETTSAGNLIAFMHTYNLRFGTATTAAQKEAYRQLYPIMVGTREKLIGRPIAAASTAPIPVPPAPGSAVPARRSPTEIFHGIDPRFLNNNPSQAAPPAPPASTPPRSQP
jgi:hypothetical protein